MPPRGSFRESKKKRKILNMFIPSFSKCNKTRNHGQVNVTVSAQPKMEKREDSQPATKADANGITRKLAGTKRSSVLVDDRRIPRERVNARPPSTLCHFSRLSVPRPSMLSISHSLRGIWSRRTWIALRVVSYPCQEHPSIVVLGGISFPSA